MTILAVLAIASSASAQLRIVSYNTASLLGSSDAFIHVLAEMGADDRPGFAVAPHVIVFQEVLSTQTEAFENLIAAAFPGVPYVMGTYTNFNENGVGGAQGMFYRSDILTEDPSGHTDIFTGAGRFTDRWRLTLNGYGNDPDAAFYIYSSHLKASPGSANRQLRLEGVQAIRANAAALPAGTHYIFAGDMNFYENDEPGYQAFIEPGAGQAVDPLGTGPWAGPNFAVKHTQSPRKENIGGLVGGGMDDRFDFQLISPAFDDGLGLSIMPGTYRAMGNDGNKWNESINLGNNFYYFWDLPRSNALADALWAASDHIPVIVDYQLPARIGGSLPANFGFALQNVPTTVTLNVWNSAPAIVEDGADALVYAVTTAAGLTGTYDGVAQPLGPSVTHEVTVNTFTPGIIAGALQINSSSQGAGSPLLLQTIGTVLRRSLASFQPAMVETVKSVEATAVSGGDPIEIEIPIYTVNWTPPQAWVQVTDVTGTITEAPFTVLTPEVGPIEGSPGVLRIGFDPATVAPGVASAFASIHWTEQTLPGAFTGTLLASLSVTVEEGKATPSTPGDLNGDGVVDLSDLLILLSLWGPCSAPPEACDADLDGNGEVDLSDLLILLGNWG